VTREGLLQIRGLTKRFGGVTALDGLDLSVEAGEVCGLIGPNGSGKSTCINVASGILHPSAGRVRFRGEDVTGLPPHVLYRRGVARTFQAPRVFRGLTVLENVLVARARYRPLGLFPILAGAPAVQREEARLREDAATLLDLVGLGVDGGVPAEILPHAKKRLLEIARALAGQPALVLLDEPAAGMNETEEGQLVRLIRQIQASGAAVVLVEHNMRVVMSLAQRITVLDFGRKIAEGTPIEVRGSPAVVEAYLGRDDDDA
jgi:ABC-type branched-subunit amino acid transport system ATPase component